MHNGQNRGNPRSHGSHQYGRSQSSQRPTEGHPHGARPRRPDWRGESLNRNATSAFSRPAYTRNNPANTPSPSDGHFSRKYTTNHSNKTSDAKQPKRTMGFRALEQLLEKDTETLILDMLNIRKGFVELLSSANQLTPDATVLIIRILRKVSDSHFIDSKIKIWQMTFTDDFVKHLQIYIASLPLQNSRDKKNNSYFWKDSDQFWNNIIQTCDQIINLIPTFACSSLPPVLNALKIYLDLFEKQHSVHVSDEIKQKIEQQFEVIEIRKKEIESKNDSKEKRTEEDTWEEPPNNFRDISVYPRSDEVIGGRGFLRPNVIKGPYRDVNHYLDVQFRLLREDFVGPLRTGIAAYRSNSKKKIENVKIHRRIRFLNNEMANEHYCMRIKFSWDKKKKSYTYENSRKFMYGSLLCFTRDNFKSLIFGKVAKREKEDLEKGELIVGFDESPVVFIDKDYIMVECSVYFEPYFHVLNVLKTMSLEGFPMEKYIIKVDPKVEPPKYFELQPDYKYEIDLADISTLNESQSAAFKAAITEEFCIIQGPPGTGKTFLGLKIAKILLGNRKLWYQRTPILVICYTNHALDQFLEGLLLYTKNIIRVGSQSKNEKLAAFNLRRKGRHVTNQAVYLKRCEVRNILEEIKNVRENLRLINLYNAVQDFHAFEEVIPNFFNTWFAKTSRDQIIDWLFEGANGPYTSNDNGIGLVQHEFNNIEIDDDDNNDHENEFEEDDEDNNGHEQLVDDDIFAEVLHNVMNVKCSRPLVTLSSLDNLILNLNNQLRILQSNQQPTLEDIIDEETCNTKIASTVNKYNYLKDKLTEGKQRRHVVKAIPKNIDFRNPRNMKPRDRWNLYFHWLDIYVAQLELKLTHLTNNFRECFKIYEEMRDIEDTKSMKEALVVGMTTTSAARLRSSLQALKSPIVIVEEAAEVLEAHIVTSLSSHCKHLILIGDHQQLRPSTSDSNIELNYKLGISLFERMIINKVQCYTLNVQHRMRPEICALISPTIYPDLENHPSVFHRPPVHGITKSLYFIDHQHLEKDCEGTSKKNLHEVQFLIYLARHLILNGYKPENITILAAYLVQMYEMQKERLAHKELLERVRIAVLDNYQGEECDIILLSLVRSNIENRIGFLKIENRVCVALSRAKCGLYIMGNMTQLCHSEIWCKIRGTLRDQNAIGSELELRCRIHTDTITYVKSSSDFLPIIEGGCTRICGVELTCNHKCVSLCHFRDRDHKEYKCREDCGRALCDKDVNHICKKRCYEKCGPCYYLLPVLLTCGHQVNVECSIDIASYQCPIPVKTTLPCGHEVDKPCHCDPVTYRCPHPCKIKVEPCGHSCAMKCHIRKDPDHLEYKCLKPCARYNKDCTAVETEKHLCRKYCYEECDQCTVSVKKHRTVCPHVYIVSCHQDVDEIDCEKPCTKILPCGHKCKSKCNEPCKRCEMKVVKINPICKHPVQVKCYEEPDRKLCNKKCPLQLPCGHSCTKKCNETCTELCEVIVPCAIASACGHTITRIKCGLSSQDPLKINKKLLLHYCNKPCREKLKCNHQCTGTCGECSQGRIHRRCNEKCGVPLVCNHECQFPCREACRPCRLQCSYKCKHSECRKKCGEICTPCKEWCPRRCPHQQCKNLCGIICDVPPCEEPCSELLKCGHPCIGFCGDPCPPKCLVCDKEELLEIFFGFEDEDSRFVLLEDCGHVLESTGLENWLQQSDNQINYKVCPKCKTVIKTTERYKHIIQQAISDVARVKEQLSGTEIENIQQRLKLQKTLDDLERECTSLGLPKLINIEIKSLKKRLKFSRKGQRQAINKTELTAVATKLQILEHIYTICSKSVQFLGKLDQTFIAQVDFILRALQREEDYITNQEVEDITVELDRLLRIFELSQIKCSLSWSYNRTREKVIEILNQIENVAFSNRRYTKEDDERLKALLTALNSATASGIGISEREKRDILKAMGFSSGHWFKCPNGHIYAIGECGGAMESSKCNECGVPIGGASHRLLPDNAVATEMDGAQHGAWSEGANLDNYDIQELQDEMFR